MEAGLCEEQLNQADSLLQSVRERGEARRGEGAGWQGKGWGGHPSRPEGGRRSTELLTLQPGLWPAGLQAQGVALGRENQALLVCCQPRPPFVSRTGLWPPGRTVCLSASFQHDLLHLLPPQGMGSRETPASWLDKCLGVHKAQGCVGLGKKSYVVGDGG